MLLRRPWLPILQSDCKTVGTGIIMRAKSQWTPGGIALWLIAAVLATFIVCSETKEPSPSGAPIEVEVEVVK